MKATTYIVYGNLESACKHMVKKCAAPWNFTVKEVIFGDSYILGKKEDWVKIIYEYDVDEEDW